MCARARAGLITTMASAAADVEQVDVAVKREQLRRQRTRRAMRTCFPCCVPNADREAHHKFDQHAMVSRSAKKKHRRRMSVDEFEGFLHQHAELWAMLGVNLGFDDSKCRAIAAKVALDMFGRESVTSSAADSVGGAAADSASLTSMNRDEFMKFYKQIVKDPKGQQRFFHACVFAGFDADGNGVLDPAELDTFLEVFYKAGSIFKGDARLPPKEELRRLIYAKLDRDGDGKLSFDEINSLISGSAAQLLNETNDAPLTRP